MRSPSRRRLAAVVAVFVTVPVFPALAEPTDDIVSAVERFVGAVPGAVQGGVLEAAARETEPVVLTGASLPGWAAPADVDAAAPSVDGTRCQVHQDGGDVVPGVGDTPLTPPETCTHNTYEDPLVSTGETLGLEGTPTDRIAAFRWKEKKNGKSKFVPVPVQVDEMFARYLSNNVSGFALYSNTDRHVSYAFDREGFRWTGEDPADPCRARPVSDVAADPVPGLDTDDEVVFMARDAGPRAPAGERPMHTDGLFEVAVTDPYDPDNPQYVYIARLEPGADAPELDADQEYVRYERDADADTYLFSESSYENYGVAPSGAYFDPATGTCVTATPKQRRPKDSATVTTPRYRFRYDGRWLMTELQVSAADEGDWTYGADMVDQWKARAFQQRPSGRTPCCGYEEEVNNWGGSSQLLGEKAGPVRVIRETWGADSGTNVVRREVFYRDEIRQLAFLRVHPIPPLDGIYVQWDHAAGAVTEYFNPFVPDGVPVDGRNDEVFGNNRVHVGLDGVGLDGEDASSDLIRSINGGTPLEIGDLNPNCEPIDPVRRIPLPWDDACVDNDVDTADPLFSGPNASMIWEQLSGPGGTLVTRWATEARDLTPGTAVHAAFALPYYRDDSCFDDGTGMDPGPHLTSRKADTGPAATWTDGAGVTRARECWDPSVHAPSDLGTRRLWQGSIGTHGIHLLLIAESDNAGTTLPLTEIVSTQRMVTLPGQPGNVGDRYGRGFEKPLVATVTPR